MNPNKKIIIATIAIAVILSGYLVYSGLFPDKPVQEVAEEPKIVLDREATSQINAIIRIYRLADGRVVLTNNGNMTLYFYASDSDNLSRCSGACAEDHPPLISESEENLIVGPAVNESSVSLFARGTVFQAAYDGKPLYTFSGDEKPGDAEGADGPGWEMASF